MKYEINFIFLNKPFFLYDQKVKTKFLLFLLLTLNK